jgi:hypothetical protein
VAAATQRRSVTGPMRGRLSGVAARKPGPGADDLQVFEPGHVVDGAAEHAGEEFGTDVRLRRRTGGSCR